MKDKAQAKIDVYVALLYSNDLTKAEKKLLDLVKKEPEVIKRIKQVQEIVDKVKRGD